MARRFEVVRAHGREGSVQVAYNNFAFIETPRAEVMVRLTETFGGVESPYDATLLSDGTLRVLAIRLAGGVTGAGGIGAMGGRS